MKFGIKSSKKNSFEVKSQNSIWSQERPECKDAIYLQSSWLNCFSDCVELIAAFTVKHTMHDKPTTISKRFDKANSQGPPLFIQS